MGEQGPRGSRLGTVAVVAVLGAAGLLFATSAGIASGTDLRSEGPDLAGLIRQESARLDERSTEVAELQEQVQELTAGVDDVAVQALQAEATELAGPAEMVAVTGPGLQVTLDDADLDRPIPDGADPDDLVVHSRTSRESSTPCGRAVRRR